MQSFFCSQVEQYFEAGIQGCHIYANLKFVGGEDILIMRLKFPQATLCILASLPGDLALNNLRVSLSAQAQDCRIFLPLVRALGTPLWCVQSNEQLPLESQFCNRFSLSGRDVSLST